MASDPIRNSGMFQAQWLMARPLGSDTAEAWAVQARTLTLGTDTAKVLLVSDVGAMAGGGGEVQQGSRGTAAASSQAWFASLVNSVAVSAATLPVVSASQSGAWAVGANQSAAGTAAWPVSISGQTVPVSVSAIAAINVGTFLATRITADQGSSGAAAWPVTVSGALPGVTITAGTMTVNAATVAAHGVNQSAAGTAAWPVSISGQTVPVNVSTIPAVSVIQSGSGGTAWPQKLSDVYVITASSTGGTIGSNAATTSTFLGTQAGTIYILGWTAQPFASVGVAAAPALNYTLYATSAASTNITSARLPGGDREFYNFFPYCITAPASASLGISVGQSATINFGMLYRTVSSA